MNENITTPTRAKKTRASEFQCVACNSQAEFFWPVIDPDIPSHPYCKKCLDRAQTELLIHLYENGH